MIEGKRNLKKIAVVIHMSKQNGAVRSFAPAARWLLFQQMVT